MSMQSNEGLALSRGHQLLQASLTKSEPLTEAQKHKMASDMLKEHHQNVQASQCTPSSQAGSHQQLSQADLPKTTSCLPEKNVLDNRLKAPWPTTSPKHPVKRAHSARTAGRTETTDKFYTAPESSRPELGAPVYEHNYVLRAPAADYPCVMDDLGNAAQLVYSTESAFVRHGFISQGSTSLLQLEKQLLEVAAYEGVTQGVLYMLRTSSGGSSIIRYFESGSFLGFLHHLQATAEVPPGFEGPRYRVFNEEDIEEERRVLLKRRDEISRKRTSGHPKEGIRNRSGERYTRYLRQLKAHLQSVKETASSSEDHADVTHLYIQILRKNASAKNKDHNYVHSIGMQPLEQELIEKALQEARLQGPYPYPFPSRTSLQSAETPLTMQQQLDALCTLSNHPKCTFPKSDGQLSYSTKSCFLTYLSYQAPRDKNRPDLQPRRLPISHRNRFIFFSANCRSSDRALLLKFIFGSRAQPPPIEAAQPSQETVVPQKRVRPPFHRVDVTPQLLGRSAGNTSSLHLKTFQHFKSKLVEVGTILWRLHTPAKEYFIMSDYGDDGEILPNSFAEVLYSHQDGAVSCSCETYRAILSVAQQEDTSDELVLPEGILCMHCRFLQEEIVQHIPELVEGKFVASSSLGQKLCDSVRTMNSPVVKLTPITSTQGTQKYSVRPRSDDSCAVINVTSGLMVFCTRGVCQAASKHKKKLKRLLELTEAAAVCEHLEAMRANQEAWGPYLQAQYDEDETDEDVEVDDVPRVPQEQSSQPPSQSRFNVETGQWDFGGYSTHKPRDESDVKLSQHVRARMAVHYDSSQFSWDSKAGTFTGLDFIPKLPTDDTCVCGSAYRSENHPEGLEPQQHFTCTLYMRHAPIRCNVFFRKCLDNCDNKVIYSGEDSSVFFWSKEVALGDEIGWDFVNKVLATKISFSAYCDEMTRTYRSNHPTSAAFISKTTFISWFFAWCGRMEIDFREHIDPWCGHDPASQEWPTTSHLREIR